VERRKKVLEEWGDLLGISNLEEVATLCHSFGWRQKDVTKSFFKIYKVAQIKHPRALRGKRKNTSFFCFLKCFSFALKYQKKSNTIRKN
jgi:hypothetical protein